MRWRPNSIWLACVAGALMLFAQYALAAQEFNCAPEDDACLVHCLAQDQQASSLDLHFNVLPSFALLAAASVASPETPVQAFVLCEERLPEGPPVRVLFCSYRT